MKTKTKAQLTAELETAQNRIAELEQAIRANMRVESGEKERLSLALDAAQAGAWEWELRTNKNTWSTELWKLYGLEPYCCEPSYDVWRDTIHPEDRPQAEQAVQAAAQNMTSLRAEWRVVDRDGSIRWLMSHGEPILDSKGQAERFVGVVIDITERKQAEEALERTRNMLAEAQKIAHLGSFEYIAATQTTVWSEEEYRIYGLDPSEPSPEYEVMLRKCIHPDDAELLHESFTRAMQTRSAYELEHRVVRPDGSVRWVYDHAKPYFDEQGELVRYLGVTLDITERKCAEAALQESEDKFRYVFDNSSVGKSLTWISGQMEVNKAFCDMLGYSAQELASTHWQEITHPDDIAASQELTESILSGKTSSGRMEKRYLHKNGSIVWVDMSTSLRRNEEGKPLYFITNVLDITERKRAERALQKAQDHLNFALEKSRTGGWDLSLVDHTAFRTLEHDRIFGYESLLPEWTFEMFLKHVVPEDRDEVNRLFQEAVRTQSDWSFECRIRRVDGELRWIWAAGEHQYDMSGQANRMSGIVQDITERKRAEEALSRRTEELEQLLDMLPEAIWIADDADCTVIHGNRFANELLGVSEKDNISQSARTPVVRLRQFSQGRELNPDELPMQMAARTGQPQVDFELRIERPDALTRTLIGGAVPLFDASGKTRGVVAAFHDITERKLVEDELRRSNAELEQFAYIASHDLQEPLRAMAGMAQLLKKRYQGQLDARADEYIGHAVEASTRMQTLIQDLLEYSRVDRRGRPIDAVSAEACLRTALKNLGTAIQESRAEIISDPLPTVHADSTQLTQLFQNLIGNSIKFRGEKEPRVRVTATQLNDAWQFAVRDNGIGIDPQYFERIFLVFQRLHTRREYQGTGIGLALCKKIVERHGGSIWLESQRGGGSTFYFTLPIKEKKP